MSKKRPQLRFEGFTDDWEERRLSEVLRERNNQQPQSMEYPLVSFTVENGVTPKTDRYEREQLVVGDKSSKKYKVTVLNDIVYNPANLKFGAISRNKYGNAVFSPIYVTFSVNNDVTMPEFIEMLITRKDFIKRALKYQQGTVYERQSVSPENLLSMNLYLPGKLEQEKIGTFFKHLDDTISLQQRKLDLLKEQKKGYLQKMFPKNGAKVPELRFSGFADDWEERKLGEVFNQTVEYINPNEANLELWSVTVERGLTPKTARYNREALVKKNDKFKVVHDGDIVYNPMNLTIGAVGFNKSEKSVAVSGYYVTMNMNSGFNNSYFQTWLKSENAIKQYKLYATGSLIEKQRVQFPTLSLIKSYIPTFEEQQKIGSFFKQIDETIALHQRKLDLLKEQKKGFLQKMFV
ncbi:restriction endonuclease subunit S [Lactococcus formosensis]|uniref:Restriction endonuclease subunit S n=2 Tax=Lactococcus formosensis TaxID=1281486 RepID=A0A9X4P796_9LACT|nr:restriction endonuclease subunit S [Lactococcus formosensis]MDG6194379.1 restriction endonuclease subunit S [Lactococcus formosensis]